MFINDSFTDNIVFIKRVYVSFFKIYKKIKRGMTVNVVIKMTVLTELRKSKLIQDRFKSTAMMLKVCVMKWKRIKNSFSSFSMKTGKSL